MIDHLTWSKPSKSELSRLRYWMLLKAFRLLLSSAAVFGMVYLSDALWPMGVSSVLMRGLSGAVLVILILYYLFRSTLIFGSRLSTEDEISDRSASKNLWFFVNMMAVIVMFFVMYFAGPWAGPVKYILTAFMSLLTYWREFFMLILFVSGKYTVKNGRINYSDDHFYIWGSTRYSRRITRVYVLDFEDEAGRVIPVMADLPAYIACKENDKAILIRYELRGNKSRLEIVKCRK